MEIELQLLSCIIFPYRKPYWSMALIIIIVFDFPVDAPILMTECTNGLWRYWYRGRAINHETRVCRVVVSSRVRPLSQVQH
jgi:hypothetical protein